MKQKPSRTTGRRGKTPSPWQVFTAAVVAMGALAVGALLAPNKPLRQVDTAAIDTNLAAHGTSGGNGATGYIDRCSKARCPQSQLQSAIVSPGAQSGNKNHKAPAPKPSKAPVKQAAVKSKPGGVGQIPKFCSNYSGNRKTGCALMLKQGFGINQFSCLNKLWNKESGWNHKARNPSSGAYGIPQSLPGNKMASAGSDWRTNPVTQIKWGLGYIKDRYGTPCSAWSHSQRVDWY